jgi:hypothetical protein
MPGRDSKSILAELKTTLLTAYSGTLARAPIAAQLLEDAQRMLDEYVNALANEKTADILRLEFLLATPGGFDVTIAGKSYGVSTRAEIDEAIAALDPNGQQVEA